MKITCTAPGGKPMVVDLDEALTIVADPNSNMYQDTVAYGYEKLTNEMNKAAMEKGNEPNIEVQRVMISEYAILAATINSIVGKKVVTAQDVYTTQEKIKAETGSFTPLFPLLEQVHETGSLELIAPYLKGAKQ